MAILKNTLMSGKVGNHRYTRYGDCTIVSELPTVNNPQSDAQMRGRLRLNNILQTYKLLKSGVGRNFQGCDDGRKVYAAFRSQNMKQMPVWLSGADSQYGGCFIIAPYVVSDGTLETIVCSFVDGAFVSDICIGDLEINSETTIKALSMAILSETNGWKQGDELQLLMLSQPIVASGEGRVPRVRLYVQDVTIGHDDHLLNSSGMKWVNNAGCLGISCEGISEKVVGVAFIHRRMKGKKTLVSRQALVLNDNTLLDAYSGDDAFRECLSFLK